MKIGYPCINWTIGCKSDRTFRLRSYSEDRLISTIQNNLDCLEKILEKNAKEDILFFRITSDLIPFASHPVCKFNWQNFFKEKFQKIGEIIKHNHLRISMHPDQFVVLNSPDEKVVERSIAELIYHTQILDLMDLDRTAKIQLHIGGAYRDKNKSIERFANIYRQLDESVKRRLVIENDDKSYSLDDCLFVNKLTGAPVLFDFFHHSILNNGRIVHDLLELVSKTWSKKDGLPMVDYSSQNPDRKIGSHADTIDIKDFKRFLIESLPFDFDIMLEIKDKENSALKAIEIAKNDSRFFGN